MSIEGKLKIVLDTELERVKQVRIDSSRPVFAARMFQGKAIQEVQKTLPLLFSICGTAQAFAGAQAIEQARGVQVENAAEVVRTQLVHMETLREHLWRILLDWPTLLGELPEKVGMVSLVPLLSDFRQMMTNGVDPFLDSSSIEYPDNHSELQVLTDKIALILEERVFNMPPTMWLGINSLPELVNWVRSTDNEASRLLAHVLDRGWSGIGCCKVMALPDMLDEQIHQLMLSDEFVARPQLKQCCETTSCTRTLSPLLTQLKSQYGNGLLVRLVARLTELAQLSMKLLPGSEDVGVNDVESHAVSVQNPGIGQVEAARGLLLHRVQLDGENILSYQIVAPTEWNFHPRGVVAHSLMTLFGDNEQIEQQARLLINAIDPCVSYQLSVN